jgi:hypothetical protein
MICGIVAALQIPPALVLEFIYFDVLYVKVAYEGLAVEAVTARGQETLEASERVAVQNCPAVYTPSWCMLKP